LLAFENVKDWG